MEELISFSGGTESRAMGLIYGGKAHPFWRYAPQGMYSEATVEMFELKKLEFENKAKYINWTVK